MQWIQRYLVLILVGASFLMYLIALWTGTSLELAVLVASVMSITVAWWLERRIPYRGQWQINQGDARTDLASAGVLIAVIDPLLKVVAPLAITWSYSTLHWQPMLGSFPLWFEILLVLSLVELGKYWSHRLHHSLSPLWWLHAMHHSSERMYFVNGLRFHPLNYIINFALSMLPVMILGASPEAIFGYLAITQPVVLIQHANIDLRHGWLNWVFSTPEVHRWHHSTLPEEANRNYGNALLIWDHVFRTFKAAEGFAADKQVGLFASSRASYPGKKNYVAQLVSMFKPSCCA